MTEELKKSFEILKTEIEKLDNADSSSKERINLIIDGINAKLNNDSDTEHHDKLLDQVNDSIVHFETSHPALSEAMSRLFNILSNMGI